MTIKEKILDVLKNEDLSVNQIIEKLPELNKDSLKVNLTRLLQKKVIRTLGENKRYRIYTLKQKNNEELLNILREMFEKGVIKVYSEKLTEEYKKTLEEL